VSLKVAEKAKVWHIEHDEALPKLPQIEIPDIRDMVYTMQGWEKDELYFEMLFQNQPSIKVWYEDLQKDIKATFAYIQGFLEVELRHNLPVLNKKMTVQKLEDLILNYKEVKNKLKGTAWEDYAV
jgi:LPS sulfotransferase NodH